MNPSVYCFSTITQTQTFQCLSGGNPVFIPAPGPVVFIQQNVKVGLGEKIALIGTAGDGFFVEPGGG